MAALVSRPTPIDPRAGRGRKVISMADGALKEETW